MVKVLVDIKTAIQLENVNGKPIVEAQIKIDDAEFTLRTDEEVKSKEELAKLAIVEYKKTYREELMGEVEMEV